jgi:DNA-binding CsgD family transcriptional regulator/tetratricopeptide (TPR) repeat protein
MSPSLQRHNRRSRRASRLGESPIDLLERGEQIQRLGQAFARADHGSGCIVAVSAEAGAGKTSLAEHFVRTRAPQTVVYWGACENLSTPEVLLPLRDIARKLGKALDMGGDHVRLFEWLLGLISDPARTSLLIIEDLHWADTATLDLLRFLARRIGSARALLLITYREEETGTHSSVRRLLGETSPGGVERISLPPLSLSAVSELASKAGRSGGEIFALTAGNPFLVTEALAAADTMPSDAVRDATLARVARLSRAARQVLEAASIFPRHAETAMVADLISGPLDAALDECIEKGMLLLEGGIVRFRHELARRAVEQSIAPSQRRPLHRKVVQELKLRTNARASELAHHAALAGDVAALLEFSRLAANQAARAGAPHEAAAHYRGMLGHRAHLDATTLVETLECCAEQSYLMGDADNAMSFMTEAAQLRRAANDTLSLGRDLTRLTRFAWISGQRAEAERYARESIAVLESLPQGPELAWAFSHQSQLDMLAFRVESAIGWGEKALSLARHLGQPEIVVHALGNVGTARADRRDGAACTELKESFDLAMAGGFHDHVQRAACNLTTIYYWRRDYPAALANIEKGIAHAMARELTHWEGYLRGWRAMIRCDLGEWAGAEEEAQDVSSRLSIAAVYRFPALIALARLRLRRGDPDDGTPLDTAGRYSATLNELQRTIYVATTQAERLWLAAEAVPANSEVLTLLREVHRTARQRQVGWVADAAAWWRYLLGERGLATQDLSPPFRALLDGDWRAAAEDWRMLRHPYEQAIALSHGDEAAQRQALDIWDRLGAVTAASRLRRLMRANGATAIPRGPIADTRANAAGLTRRQTHVLELIGEGMTNAEIAARLCISHKTAEHHVSAIMARLGATSRREAVAEARRRGLLDSKR